MDEKTINLYFDAIFMTQSKGDNLDFRDFIKSVVSIKNFHSLNGNDAKLFIAKIVKIYLEGSGSNISENIKEQLYLKMLNDKSIDLSIFKEMNLYFDFRNQYPEFD
jgi:hypothetical protein